MTKKVLLIVESCNPEMSSVPLVGYNFFRLINGFSDVQLVTHCRNREALAKHGFHENVTYYEQTLLEVIYYKVIAFLSTYRGQVVWPIRHALQYPIYFFFNRFVYKTFAHRVAHGEYDIVHALTPMMPRYPYKILQACRRSTRKVPFILGPVNGGVPFPSAFKQVARKEFSFLNWLRSIGNWIIPGYRRTYNHSDIILAGSSYTLSWIKKNFRNIHGRVELMYENGVPDAFYNQASKTCRSSNHFQKTGNKPELNLLFIGRLEPYKGCDMLLESVARLVKSGSAAISLTIIGDGSEEKALKKFVEDNQLQSNVKFLGWIPHTEVSLHCASSDIFCFPSVREFGGAVVMEAMASGLPCVVVDNGGIGEYVTEECGVKISPEGRNYVIEKLETTISELLDNPSRLETLTRGARSRAREFSWKSKAVALEKLYDSVTSSRKVCQSVAVSTG